MRWNIGSRQWTATIRRLAWRGAVMAVGLAASSACGADWSLQLNGTSQYASFGAATATLGASNFTLECWFKRTAAGVATTTGSGGITAVPLLAKGRGEADASDVDCNYFLGITTNGTLGADFEEYPVAGGTAGLNHPVVGRTVLANGTWYHAAATYNGRQWSLYLNGNLETALVVNASADRPPRWDSRQHAGLGTALTSAGAAAGFFQGQIGESRVWNTVRSQAEIRDGMTAKTTSGPGLLGRWGLDEGAGTTASNSVAGSPAGTLMGGPVWTNDAPPLIAINAVWKYLDDGSNQGSAWQTVSFDDGAWASGPAELGYGDGDEKTVLGYGSDANNKFVTAYFRRAFAVADPAAYSRLNLRAIRDDGMVVYLNGTEIWRNNMPAGTIASTNYAAAPEISGAAEYTWIVTNVPIAALVAGTNVVAVEIHQQRAASSDISFNFELAGAPALGNQAPSVTLTAPAAGSALPTGTPVSLTAAATDDATVAKVEFFVNGIKAGEDAASPFSFDWTPAAPGRAALTAVATDNLGLTGASAAVVVSCFEAGTGALQLDGVNDHVTFGQAANLGAAAFTLECWMRKLGPGLTSSSGNGGITAVPLVTKGRGEAENSNVDCNYFFGLLPSGALAADFEQFYADGGAAGQNYPVTGVSTSAADGAWHHVAATYDGSNWVLYLDGSADRTLYVGPHTPRFDSIQHAGLGVALNSSGVPEGAFEGTLDDVRIWNYARSAAQIAANVSNALAAANGLVGRWSLNDGSGTAAASTVAGAPAGALVNGPLWCLGQSLIPVGSAAPVVSLTAPANGATLDAGAPATLTAQASDDDGSVVSVSFQADGSEIGSDDTAPYSVVWSAVPAGTYALRAVATDNAGLSATSAAVTITVVAPNLPPAVSLLSPADGASDVVAPATLSAQVTDPEGLPLTVSFYGRLRGAASMPGPDFTVVALPDTQYYSESYPAIFQNQTDWIVANRTNLNIVYVAHLGDMTDDSDNLPYQWTNAAAAMYRLEDPATTGLPEGIPYGPCLGNHDHTGNTAGFNQFFSVSHFSGKSWYGGHMGSDNQNHYDLISASGLDFVFLFMDWNYANLDYAPIDAWADGVLKAQAGRRAVVINHDILAVGGAWDARGQAIYNNLKDNPNLFLMLCGHNHGEGKRSDVFEGRTVYSCLSDYQSYANGGNGFLRLYQFSPSNNLIRVKTYSPYLNQFETDSESQFDLAYDMGAGAEAPFELIGVSNNVPSGSAVSLPWAGLATGTNYEWYAVANDGASSVTSAPQVFATTTLPEPVIRVSNPYSNVNWAAATGYKANLHTHTTQSDGNQAPAAVIDGYQALNFDALAITDHDKVTYPWTAYGRDPATVGMLAIQGNELSQGHHIVSLFNGFASSSADAHTLLTGVAASNGIAFFAHPGRYSYDASWYAALYQAHPHCMGQEIYNQGDRYTGDRVKWDQVLSTLMPARPVWGFSNDDSHDASHIGRNRTYLLMSGLTSADARASLVRGEFYGTYSTSGAHVPPAITNIAVNEVAGTITVGGTGYTQVRWFSQGNIVGTGETLDLVGTPGVAKYVRVELQGAEGLAFSNPFGLLPTGNQAPAVNAGSDLAVTLPNAAALSGSASDDGLPNPPGTLTLEWTTVSGQGSVTFANAAAAQTTATFSEAGTYVLRLTASDGALSAYDELTVTVSAPVADGWTAYNDCSWASGQINTRITTYGLNQSGAMVDYATGAALPVTVQVVNNPSAPATANGTGGPMPNSGTDAYNTFNGIVSFANVIYYGNTGWWVDAVITGLDPSRRYEFATSCNRGSSSYTTRWSKFTLSNADAAIQASTPGVQVNSDLSVSIWSGYNNVNGQVARWTEIRPGADGSFTVRAEADGQLGHATREGYAFDGILLRDLGPAAPEPLSVSLTAPAAGQSFAANETVTLAAVPIAGTAPQAVRFYTNRLGGAYGQAGSELSAAPWQLELGPLSPGSYSVYAVATDAASGVAVSVTNAFTVTTLLNPVTNTLIAAGSAWAYLDDGSDQGAAWRAPGFDDAAWAAGPAPLGYEDSWIVTTVNSPARPNRTITTYFRKEFTVSDPSAYSELNIGVMRDDGAVVYLNGVEVFRSNMPEGPIDYLTFSSSIVSGADESTFFPGTIPANQLVSGRNVIAVELHQRDGDSSDLGFDLRLTAVTPAGNLAQAPALAVSLPAERKVVVPNGTATFTLAGTASRAEGVLQLTNTLGSAAEQPAADTWTFANVPLAEGVNRLAITAGNAAGTVTQTIVVIRQAAPASGTLRLAVFSDPHYFAPNLLLADGPAFQAYLAQDRKLIAESPAITEEVVDQLIARNANYVLVTGDLTKDGELDSHLGFAAELARLEAAGAQALVIPGNHDINSPAALAYDGTNAIPVPNVSPEQFRGIYAAYGYDLAGATDTASVAYSVALTPDILLLCMDSCQYGATAGSVATEQLAWITNQLAEARAAGRLALGMMHHGLLEHFPGQKTLFSEYVVDGHEMLAPVFAEYGLRAVFTGHFHANDVVKGVFGGRGIYDIETGSTVTWPCPYRVAELDGNGVLALATHHVTSLEHDLAGAPDFQTYAQDYLTSGMLGLSSYMLQAPPYNLPAATADSLAPAVTEALVWHYAGDEPGLAGATPLTQAIVASLLGGDPLSQMLGQAIASILTDSLPSDNALDLPLAWPPVVVIESPADGASVGAEATGVTVSVSPAGVVGELTYANVTMGVTVQSAATSVMLPLRPGMNELTVTGTNSLGETASDTIQVARLGGPGPDVKVNGSDSPIVLPAGGMLSVTISLDCAGFDAIRADWWVLAYHADSDQWYQYVAPFTTSSWRPWTGGTSLQAPLVPVSNHEALRLGDLEAGTWTFYFGVDAPQDGIMDMDMLFFDSATATVMP